jgi:outer membrane lipoprotein SlyB
MSRLLKLLALGIAAATLAGCVIVPRPYGPYRHHHYYSDAAPDGGAYGAAPAPAPAVASAGPGTVTHIVVLGGEPAYTSGGGAVAGAIVGGVVGRQFGGSSAGRAVGTLIGAFGGAVVGNEMERQSQGAGRPPVYRVTVRLDSGDLRSYDYASLNNLRIGDRVRDEGGQLYR